MIKVKIDTDGKKQTVYMPEGWHEVTLQQALTIEKKYGDLRDSIGMLSVFSGLSEEQIANTHTNLWEQLISIFAWINEEPQYNKIKIPKQVTLNSKKVNVPSNLKLETFGQKVLAMQNLQDKSYLDAITQILSAYLQPNYDEGPFDFDKAVALEEHVKSMSCLEGIPLSRFFLSKLRSLNPFTVIGLSLWNLTRLRNLFGKLQEAKD